MIRLLCLRQKLQVFFSFVLICGSIALDSTTACDFTRLAKQNYVGLDYSQKLHELIDSPEELWTSDSDARQCAMDSFLSIEEHFKNLLAEMKQMTQKIQLNSALREAGEILRKVPHVTRAFQTLKTMGNSTATEQAVRYECATQNPKNLLHDLSYISRGTPSLFQEIVEGTGYSLTEFNRLAFGIRAEAEVCALLAIKCIRWIESSVDDKLWDRYRNETTATLINIDTDIQNAINFLRDSFPSVVRDDLQRMLFFTTENAFSTQKSANYIYEHLTRKFVFMEWVVMQYNYVRDGAYDKHAHESFSNAWFRVSNAHYTVVVHAADIQRNCSWFGDRILGKSLEQLFGNDRQNYERLVSDGRDLRNSIATLKTALISLDNFPQNYMISVISNRMDFQIAPRSPQKFHFFENVPQQNGRGFSKQVMIGWC